MRAAKVDLLAEQAWAPLLPLKELAEIVLGLALSAQQQPALEQARAQAFSTRPEVYQRLRP